MKTARMLPFNRLVFPFLSLLLVIPFGCGDDSVSAPAEVRSSTDDLGASEPAVSRTPVPTGAETPAPTETPPTISTATPAPPPEDPPPSATMSDPTRSPEPIPTSTPTQTSTPAEPTPEPIVFPGCDDVTAESHYCLTLSGGQVSLLGLDSGSLCPATTTDAPSGNFLPGGSIAWQNEYLYVCGQGGLIRISLRDGNWEMGGTPCLGVASYDGGLLVNRWLLPFSDSEDSGPWSDSPLSWYPSYEAALNDAPERTFDLGTWSETMSVQGDHLYTAWHAGISIDVADLEENRPIGVLTLEDYNGWMLGMSVTEDGHLVLSGDPWGASVYVFDAYDGHFLQRIDLGSTLSGLACVAGEDATPRDTPTVTPTPTFNPAQEPTSTPCADWFDCPDHCTELLSDPNPFRLQDLPPSIPSPESCDSGYGASNYVVPGELLVEDAAEELHVVGVYEGRGNPGFRPNAQGVVDVVVRERPKPVALALSSHDGMLWRITLEPGALLSRVILHGYYEQEVEGVPAGVPVIERSPERACGYAYGWEVAHNSGGGQYASMIASLRRFTGLVETSFQGCYAGRRFTVPHWSGDPPTGTPTPVPGDEDLPREDVTFPGCEPVTSEDAYCLTTTPASIAVVGLQSGQVCHVAASSAPGLGHHVHSLSWRGEIAYVCTHEHGLMRVSLRDGSWQAMQVDCEAVADYDGGLLLLRPYFRDLSLFQTLEGAFDGKPVASYSFDGGYSRIATSENIFYGAWHSTDQIIVGDLASGESLPPLQLESFDGWVHGMARTSTNELVLIGYAESLPARRELFFFDVASGAKRKTVPVSDWIGGLACVAPPSGDRP